MKADRTPGSMEVWHALLSLNRKLSSRADQAFAEHTLRFIEFRTLFYLKRGPSPMVSLAIEIGVTKAAITSIIDDLEMRELVKRVQDPSDRRIMNIEMTMSGRRLLARAEETHSTIVSRLLAELTSEERVVLVRCYEKIVRALDKLPKE